VNQVVKQKVEQSGASRVEKQDYGLECFARRLPGRLAHITMPFLTS
jgi:hypothetical protein